MTLDGPSELRRTHDSDADFMLGRSRVLADEAEKRGQGCRDARSWLRRPEMVICRRRFDLRYGDELQAEERSVRGDLEERVSVAVLAGSDGLGQRADVQPAAVFERVDLHVARFVR